MLEIIGVIAAVIGTIVAIIQLVYTIHKDRKQKSNRHGQM